MNHCRQVEILAKFFGGFLEFGMVHSIHILFYADYFLHDVDAFNVFGIFGQNFGFGGELGELLPEGRVHSKLIYKTLYSI